MLARHLGSHPTRVLMTVDAVGGVWRYALELARGLASAGTEVVLAIMGPPARPEQLAEAAAINGVRVVEGSFELEWMPGADDDVLRAGAWLMELEATYAPDLVHLNGYAHAALPWHAPVVVVAHSCVLSWWRAVHGEEAPAEWDGYRRRTAAGLRAADLVVAPDPRFLRDIQSVYGPGISRPRDLERPRREQYRGDRQAADGLGCRPHLGRRKEPQMLASVATDLPWPVCVAGPGAPERGDGAALARNLRWLGRSRLPRSACGTRRPPSSSRRHATSRSVWPRSRRRLPAARSCSATSLRCASSGPVRPCSCRRTTASSWRTCSACSLPTTSCARPSANWRANALRPSLPRA